MDSGRKINKRQAGFTLIEIIAVLFLIAVMYSIAVTFFTGNSARIRSASGQLVSDLQSTYLRSLQKSKIHRIEFSADLRTYAIQEFVPPMEKPKNEDDREAMERWDEYQRRLEEMNPQERAKLTRMDRGTFAELKRRSLPSNIELKHFYTTRSEITDKAPKLIYFFPSGQADQVAIVLSDGSQLHTTVQLNPITGKVSAANEELTQDQWKKMTESK